jgi:hypothetical protein
VLQRVARSLDELERRHDPEEWERARQATAQRRARREQDAAHSV